MSSSVINSINTAHMSSSPIYGGVRFAKSEFGLHGGNVLWTVFLFHFLLCVTVFSVNKNAW